jgi:Co/Zn/Cd efflux system component
MFGLELIVGLLAGSIALLADSLDMLGDAMVYVFSRYVVGRSLRWRVGAALLKGVIMAGFGLTVLTQVGYRLFSPEVPDFQLMGITGVLALAANVTCLLLLTRHCNDDLNMSSTWICSRNDIIANVSVLLAALAVFATGSMWLDLVVGLLVNVVFMRSSLYVVRQALAELRRPSIQEVPQLSVQPVVLMLQRCGAGTCPETPAAAGLIELLHWSISGGPHRQNCLDCREQEVWQYHECISV